LHADDFQLINPAGHPGTLGDGQRG
jgi:hypothetical protein